MKYELTNDGTGILLNGKLIVSCWPLAHVDETRLEGESWLSMRERTKSERERLHNDEPKALALSILMHLKSTKQIG